MAEHQVVAPTIRNRIDALDAMRGLALLAILLSNIAAFGGPVFSEMLTGAGAPRSVTDGWIESWHTALVAGKARAMLAILFGVGLYLQFAKRSHEARNWPGGYMKRMLFLGLIGLLHGLLLWNGDILLMYALTAFGACLMVRLQDRVLLLVCAVLMAWNLLCFGGMGAALSVIGTKAEVAGAYDLIEREVKVFATGSYAEQFMFRVEQLGYVLSSALLFAVAMMPLFLCGILLARSGVLAKPREHTSIRNACLGWGLGLGLPLNLVALLGGGAGPSLWAWLLIEGFSSYILAIGYVMLAAVIFEGARSPRLSALLRPVGRVALSAYFLQTLLCTTFFYSWGLAYFDKLTRAQMLVVVLGVWAINLAFAHLWIRAFSLGPVEWAWRSLTEGRVLPIRKGRELREIDDLEPLGPPGTGAHQPARWDF